MSMHLQPMPTPQSIDLAGCAQRLLADIKDVNQALDRQAARGTASEDFLQGQLERLPGRGHGEVNGYWPTLARLAELTLYSAGCLALAGEFAACGDLLINPDGKLLHIMGAPQPLAIKRHQALTRQVAHLVPAGWQTISWLKQRTFLEVPQKALLPRLREELEVWPQPGSYLQQLDQDWETLASSLALLAGLDTGSSGGLPETLARTSPSERPWLESRIYRPDLRRFHALGRIIDQEDNGD